MYFHKNSYFRSGLSGIDISRIVFVFIPDAILNAAQTLQFE